MERPRFSFNQSVITGLVVVGLVALSAVAFNYRGQVHLRLGADGIQLWIDGSSE